MKPRYNKIKVAKKKKIKGSYKNKGFLEKVKHRYNKNQGCLKKNWDWI